MAPKTRPYKGPQERARWALGKAASLEHAAFLRSLEGRGYAELAAAAAIPRANLARILSGTRHAKLGEGLRLARELKLSPWAIQAAVQAVRRGRRRRVAHDAGLPVATERASDTVIRLSDTELAVGRAMLRDLPRDHPALRHRP